MPAGEAAGCCAGVLAYSGLLFCCVGALAPTGEAAGCCAGVLAYNGLLFCCVGTLVSAGEDAGCCAAPPNNGLLFGVGALPNNGLLFGVGAFPSTELLFCCAGALSFVFEEADFSADEVSLADEDASCCPAALPLVFSAGCAVGVLDGPLLTCVGFTLLPG